MNINRSIYDVMVIGWHIDAGKLPGEYVDYVNDRIPYSDPEYDEALYLVKRFKEYFSFDCHSTSYEDVYFGVSIWPETLEDFLTLNELVAFLEECKKEAIEAYRDFFGEVPREPEIFHLECQAEDQLWYEYMRESF